MCGMIQCIGTTLTMCIMIQCIGTTLLCVVIHVLVLQLCVL